MLPFFSCCCCFVVVSVCSGSLYSVCWFICLRFALQSVKHACLCFQGLSVAVGVSQTQVSYLKQQLRSVITQYLSRFLPATPTIGAVANHPVLLAGCEATPTARGAALRRTILQALRFKIIIIKSLIYISLLCIQLEQMSECAMKNCFSYSYLNAFFNHFYFWNKTLPRSTVWERWKK